MTGPFSSGNKELLSQARRNPIKGNDDLLPSYWEQTAAAFNTAYYEVGIGIKIESRFDLKQESAKISELDLSFDDKHDLYNLYELKYNNFNKEAIDRKITPERQEYLNGILERNKDKIKAPEDLRSENQSRIKGEFKTAQKTLAQGDAITAKLAGGIGGAFTSPALIGSMFIPMGQEFAIAKTGSVVTKILKAGAIEGAIGAAVETTTIPQQKKNAAFLGKKYDNWNAAKNIALAGGGGFIFGALLKSGSSAFDYIKDIRSGVDEAGQIIKSQGLKDDGSIRYIDDFAYTSERAIKGDEFKPLYDEGITNEQFIKHIEDSKRAYDEAFEWGTVAENKAYQENLPRVSADEPPRINDDLIYSEYLTDADRAFDKKLFNDAAKIDNEIPLGLMEGETGERIIKTANSKELLKKIDSELTGLEAIAMCMRGRK